MLKLSRILPFVVVALLTLHTHTASAQKTYNFPAQNYGECNLLIGKITFNPDGTGFWEATTSSDRSYGTMGVTITARSSGHTALVVLPQWFSPRMATPAHYPWTKAFTYDRSIYNDIATGTDGYGCTMN